MPHSTAETLEIAKACCSNFSIDQKVPNNNNNNNDALEQQKFRNFSLCSRTSVNFHFARQAFYILDRLWILLHSMRSARAHGNPCDMWVAFYIQINSIMFGNLQHQNPRVMCIVYTDGCRWQFISCNWSDFFISIFFFYFIGIGFSSCLFLCWLKIFETDGIFQFFELFVWFVSMAI